MLDTAPHMLTDTGSDVSIIRKDVWDLIYKGRGPLQEVSGKPITFANGGKLHILGQTKVPLQGGEVKDDFSRLITPELTHKCIPGVDFW